MRVLPEHARKLLARVDPGRLLDGWPVGLRDGALLALLSVGLSVVEISGLRALSVSMARGKVIVSVKRHGYNWFIILPPDLGGHLLAWLSERRLWASPAPLFTSPQGPLSLEGIYTIVKRYRHKRSARPCKSPCTPAPPPAKPAESPSTRSLPTSPPTPPGEAGRSF